MSPIYLTFSDGAKYADIARNIITGNGYLSLFNFWGANNAQAILPGMPFSIALFFKIFGVTDLAVIATSITYFVLSLIFVFLLSKKIFKNNLTAVLSTLAIGFNYDLINYATSGASESLFIFEIIASIYLFIHKKKWTNVLGFIFLILIYFTRAQGVVYIISLIILFFAINFSFKKAALYSSVIAVFGSIIYLIFSKQSVFAITQSIPGVSASDSLRGAIQTAGMSVLIKKVFYNLYNFYKLLPQIISPYMFGLFLIGIFKFKKEKIYNSFKIISAFIVLVTFITTALTIPFFRYIHPIIPLVYIVAVGTVVEVVSMLMNHNYGLLNKVKNPIIVNLISITLILFFGIGQTLGVIFLDSRFEKQNHNVGKPPVYVVLGQTLGKYTNSNQTIITNLDTWGSWYGNRKTIWFPLEPKQLINSTTGKIPFDAIYLTNYLIDDQNYYMNNDWREILNNPNNPNKWICDGCGEIAKEFTLKGVYAIGSNDNYERQDSKAVLLVRK